MNSFELLLFSSRPELIQRGLAAGINGFIVDLECTDKEERQGGADTMISGETWEHLAAAGTVPEAHVICRVDNDGRHLAENAARAVALGADEVLLPMVRTVTEVEAALTIVAGRCPLSILIETTAALAVVRQLNALPLHRIYVGLNDLAIERGLSNIFLSLVDGTVERIRAAIDKPFGIAGLTLPERGAPIPCRLILNELARLECSFSFLRRSFLRDAAPADWPAAVSAIRAALERARASTAAERERLHRDLCAQLLKAAA